MNDQHFYSRNSFIWLALADSVAAATLLCGNKVAVATESAREFSACALYCCAGFHCKILRKVWATAYKAPFSFVLSSKIKHLIFVWCYGKMHSHVVSIWKQYFKWKSENNTIMSLSRKICCWTCLTLPTCIVMNITWLNYSAEPLLLAFTAKYCAKCELKASYGSPLFYHLISNIKYLFDVMERCTHKEVFGNNIFKWKVKIMRLCRCRERFAGEPAWHDLLA